LRKKIFSALKGFEGKNLIRELELLPKSPLLLGVTRYVGNAKQSLLLIIESLSVKAIILPKKL
jgi:hypothetical protein